MPAMDFIKRLIQHIPEKHFKQIRYYGLYARHREPDKKLRRAVPKEKHAFILSFTRWRNLIASSFGYDPLKCPGCGTAGIQTIQSAASVQMAVGQETAVCAFRARNVLLPGSKEAEQIHALKHQHQQELEDFKSNTLLPVIPIPGAAALAYAGLLQQGTYFQFPDSMLLFTPGFCIYCKARKNAQIQPRGNSALRRRRTSNGLNSVTVSTKGVNSNDSIDKLYIYFR